MSLVHGHLTSGALSGSRQQHIRVPVAMDKMNGARSEKIDQSLQKHDHPRCSWHILFGTRR
uniref:Uncharacterized protein n=1 Tax=Oryza glaberrima TaxID=4538 RepID=I1QID2_ORYGL